MRQSALFVVVFLLSLGTSFAQEWTRFTSEKDHFSVNFPGEPKVTDIIWETEYGGKLPGRVYTVKQGASTYSVTVVDYNPLRAQQEAKERDCATGTKACIADTAARRESSNGIGYWRTDIRGAIVYATFKYLQRDVKVNYYMWNWLGGGPEAHELQLTNNADQSRTFVSIYMHHNWLYMVDGTGPANIPPPGLFQQSIGLSEPDPTLPRHRTTYYNAAQPELNVPRSENGGAAR